MKNHFDIIIVGGGIVGLAFACAVAKATDLSIAILETKSTLPTWNENHTAHRVSAITLASVKFFHQLAIWDDIKNHRASPFRRIEVIDELGKGKIEFDSAEISESVLGYIIENNLIHLLLLEKIKLYRHVTFFNNIQLHAFDHNHLIDQHNQHYSGKLLIAADGANSWLRSQASITISKKDYHQQAIVATISSSKDHLQIARQIFLATGPLAFLPLTNKNSSSIVWSLPNASAIENIELPNRDFCANLEKKYQHLGKIDLLSDRFSFPLFKLQAKNYVANNIVLLGDAAHVVHPLAGQGVNIGLADALSLSNLIQEAYVKNKHIADERLLKRYQRERKAENLLMLQSIDWLESLFANHQVSLLRSAGLTMLNLLPIKNWLVRQAVY